VNSVERKRAINQLVEPQMGGATMVGCTTSCILLALRRLQLSSRTCTGEETNYLRNDDRLLKSRR
jgi:hypothetical protein